MFELLENRFKKEGVSFSKAKEYMYYRKALYFCNLPFKSIHQEKLNLENGKNYLLLAKRDSIEYKLYGDRAKMLSVFNAKNRTDSVTEFIEQLLLKSYNLNPKDYHVNYDLFVFYYNEGATLMRSIEYDSSEKEISEIQEKAKVYFEKALFYAEKIGLADKYRDRLKVK